MQTVYLIGEFPTRRLIRSFYQEDHNKSDAVYIGASNQFAYWEAPIAWNAYGIAVNSLSCPAQPPQAIKYMMEEVRRTQPDALCIVNLNSLVKRNLTEGNLHTLLDYIPWSRNKMKMVEALCDETKLDRWERLEYYFPVIRFHNRWTQLTGDDFYPDNRDVKGAVDYYAFLNISIDHTGKWNITDEETTLPGKANRILNDLLDYCDEVDAEVLFVFVPQSRSLKDLRQFNTITRIVEERGYTVLNLIDNYEEIGLNLEMDIRNARHTNVHGALKYTCYLGEYLRQNYGFEDKRGEKEYQDWDQAAETYMEMISPYTLDFERQNPLRDYALTVPENLQASVEDAAVSLTWETVEGAEGYMVYRKETNMPWEVRADTSEVFFTEDSLPEDTEYSYTVVPYRRDENGAPVYGKFNYYGIPVEL